MLNKMKLKAKLLIAFLSVGVIPLAVVGVVSLFKASDSLSEASYAQLTSVREIKKKQIEDLFAKRKSDISVLMHTVASLRQGAFAKLEAVQDIKKSQIEDFFAKRWDDISVLASNRQVIEAMQAFNTAFSASGGKAEGDMYQSVEERLAPWLKQYKSEFGYYDLLLIYADGNVVYSVNKESDLGQNVISGPLKDSGLGKAFRKGMKEISFADFEPYEPAMGAYIAFIVAPIKHLGSTIGVVALQFPSDPINAIVQKRNGMGETGETYLVGSLNDKTAFRSDMKTLGKGTFIIGTEISTPYIKEALSGVKGRKVVSDSNGGLVMVAYDPLSLKGLKWAMVSRIKLEEAIAPRLPGEKDDYFTKYVKQYGFDDLLLIHPNGLIFYTVDHEEDYNTNIITGKYAKSGLGKLTSKVLATKSYAMADFEPYDASDGHPVAFIAQPYLVDGKPELVVALRLSSHDINAVMTQRQGMGKTGETYLIGPDMLMRSDSFRDPKTHSVAASFADPEKGKVDTEAARLALAGKSGEEISRNYKGKSVLSAFAPVKLHGLSWALLAEIEESEAFAAVKAMKWMMTVLAVVGIAIIVGVAMMIGQAISRPIDRAVAGLNEGSDQVAASASQVSAASQSLADGSGRQASSLEETVSSLEEMAAMARQNADHASQANVLMGESKNVINQANNSMSELKEAMERITHASDETAKIIKTIDEIAFQTNLLALNAAVEAARAGQAGAGFAVVADEVRNLAMRAAEAAKNTQELIEDTIKNIKDGAGLVEHTDTAFGEVAVSTDKVGELIGEIAAASQEQTQGIEHINSAASEMDQITQQVAANAEESAASSEELSAQAETMKGMVSDLAALVNGSGNHTQIKGKANGKDGKGKVELVAGHLKKLARRASQDQEEEEEDQPKRLEAPEAKDEDFADF